MSILVDVGQWPVVQTVWDGDQTADDIARYTSQVLELYARRQPFVTVTWMKRYKASPEVRRGIAELMRKTQADVKQFSVGSALICSSSAFRFALSTVFLLKRPDTPYAVCATFEEAERFCREQARLRRLVLPNRIIPLVAP